MTKMTKKEIEAARENVGYSAKAPACNSCQHHAVDRVLPDWMVESNGRRRKMAARSGHAMSYYTVEANGLFKNRRCTMHGFPVASGGYCSHHTKKD